LGAAAGDAGFAPSCATTAAQLITVMTPAATNTETRKPKRDLVTRSSSSRIPDALFHAQACCGEQIAATRV
jgi:hypothetical protein